MTTKLAATAAVVASVFLTGFLGGCPPSQSLGGQAGQLESATGMQAIPPTRFATVGRLYREGPGDNPRRRFSTFDGTVYSEICPNDFEKTTGPLKDLSGYIAVDKATPGGSFNTAANFKPSLAGIGAELISLTASAGYSGTAKLDYTQVDTHLLSPEGRRLIWAELSSSCRSTIGSRPIFVMTGVARANSVTMTLSDSFGGSVSSTVRPGQTSPNAIVSRPSIEQIGVAGGNNQQYENVSIAFDQPNWEKMRR